MAEGGITPAEYRQWQSPRLVLFELMGALGIQRAEMTARIIEGLAKGSLSAACYRAISRALGLVGGESTLEFCRIPRTAWRDGYQPQEALWDSGDVKFEKFGLTGALVAWDGPRECIGIRFEPIGIELLGEQLAAPSQRPALQITRAPRPIKPIQVSHSAPMVAERRIDPNIEIGRGPTEGDLIRYHAPAHVPTARKDAATNAQVDAWYAALSPEDQEQSVRWLHKRARDDLGLNVVRTQVEPFRRGKGAGRKRKL